MKWVFTRQQQFTLPCFILLAAQFKVLSIGSKEILNFRELNLIFVCLFASVAEYKILCPGGEGFRPNPITVILEGNSVSFILKRAPWNFLELIYSANDMLLFSS